MLFYERLEAAGSSRKGERQEEGDVQSETAEGLGRAAVEVQPEGVPVQVSRDRRLWRRCVAAVLYPRIRKFATDCALCRFRKTALVRRYTEGKFTSNYKITIGADFAIKSLDWDPQTKINLQLWDVAGHERFGYMTRVYYKYAVAAALVFDISRIATFQSIKKWLSDLREKVTLPDGGNIPVVLLANKCDIPYPVVPIEQIAKFCKENNIGAWYVTSAKENTNVDVAMRYLVENVLKTRIDGGVRDSVSLRDRPVIREKTSCCKS
nr:ras-related protein Rab-38-like isoform X2 [Megalopta genalis]